MKQALQNLVAQGKTKQVLDKIVVLTPFDSDLRHEVVLLSYRFTEYERKQRMKTESTEDLNLERNRINEALILIIDKLNDMPPPLNFIDNPTDTSLLPSNKKIPFWISIGFLLLMIGITIIKPEWTSQQSVLFKTLLALAAAGFVALLPGVLNYEIHNGLKATGAFATFVLVYLLNPETKSLPFSIVVYTHGQEGKQNIVNMKETKLVADFGGRREVAKVGENGQNTFNEIPNEFKNTRIGIGLHGQEGYILTYKDSSYLLDGKPIYLAVKLENIKVLDTIEKKIGRKPPKPFDKVEKNVTNDDKYKIDTIISKDKTKNGEFEYYETRVLDKEKKGLVGIRIICEDCEPEKIQLANDGNLTLKRNKSNTYKGEFSEIKIYNNEKEIKKRIYWYQKSENIEF